MDNKNKISIITNIEVNINQNNLTKPNNTNNIINLNINNQRPTTRKKIAHTPFNLPISQISNNASNSPNLILSTNPISLKPSDLNKPRNLQSSQLFNDHRIIIRDTKKKDAETQTEEIFFKM